ncbi:MAG: universal stress protein [Verrucomicrobiales bacterium]
MKLERILVPVDFSDNSRKAVEAAVELHKFASGQLILLYVLEPLVITFGEALPTELPTDEKRMVAANVEMEKLGRSLSVKMPAETLVLDGTSWDVICDVADRKNVDLIVIASHGYKGLKRFVLGSTAERVVRHAHCPVLVVKPNLDAAGKHWEPRG